MQHIRITKQPRYRHDRQHAHLFEGLIGLTFPSLGTKRVPLEIIVGAHVPEENVGPNADTKPDHRMMHAIPVTTFLEAIEKQNPAHTALWKEFIENTRRENEQRARENDEATKQKLRASMQQITKEECIYFPVDCCEAVAEVLRLHA